MRKADALQTLAAVTSLREGAYKVGDVYVLTGHVDQTFAESVLSALGETLSELRHAHAVMSGLAHLQYGDRGTALVLCRRAKRGTFPVTAVTPAPRGNP